ncbi:MAG TPA: YggT family protein [Phenylobacterium sp.]|jgi:YggT family protein
MISFAAFIIYYVVGLLEFAIIANAIISWLLVFNVINIRHPVARQVVYFLEAVTRPLLWPFRKVIPPIGGVDVTPILALIVLEGIRGPLLRWVVSLLSPLLG